MAGYISFSFNINDPEFNSQTTVVNPNSPYYVAHAFLRTPIYDNVGVKIGYKVSDDYIQQLSPTQYSVRINSTYYIENQGTINWSYSFINNKPSQFYPVGVLASSNITSTTGNFFGKTGAVALMPNQDGSRNVTIAFNF
jgi:hypothetical protein